MRVGVSFPTTEIGNDPAVIRDFAQAIEEMGYDHLTCIDHVIQAGAPEGGDWRSYYTRDNPFHEPLVMLGFLAAATRTIGLATAILILPQRPTVLVAKQLAELDVLSGGRLRAGIGIGWNEVEFKALGQNFRNRGRRMEEQVALMRALWTNELLDYQGKWHAVENAGLNPLPVQRPIPIWFGAFQGKAIKRAGRLGDGWFLNPRLVPGEELAAQIAMFRAAATEAGRDATSLGMDGTLHYGGRSDNALVSEFEAYREIGASHLTVRTLYSDLPDIAAHLKALGHIRTVLPKQ